MEKDKKEKIKWPNGPNYFNKTNVGAIVRSFENKELIKKQMNDLVNYPALTSKESLF